MHTKAKWYRYIGYGLIFLALTGSGMYACGSKSADDEFFVQVGNSAITVIEYKQEVAAAAEEAFPGEREIPDAVKKDLRMRVLNQLTEELLISEHARNRGLSISEAELDREVAAIKADYPDNTFEDTLLENAISFQTWRQKLGRGLLVKKVIGKELVDKVKITPEDVSAYYQVHYPQGPPEEESAEQLNKRIVYHLRQQKAEKMYPEWIEKLRKAYPVVVNQKQWNRLAEVH